VLTWPQRINPIFDRNEELIEQSKQGGEKILLEKKEKVIMELEKLRQRVDEFNDYGTSDNDCQGETVLCLVNVYRSTELP